MAAALVLASAACATSESEAGSKSSARSAPASTTTTAAEAEAIDCTDPSSCRELVVEGDAPATLPDGAPSPLRGYADPTIRRDPVSGELWMSYSWPSVHAGSARTTRVEAHLARSADDGRTWQAAGPLWVAEPATEPATGSAGWTDHEVPDLLPLTLGGGPRWIAARLDLFVPAGQGLGRRPPSSFRIAVLAAGSPLELPRAEPVVLGSAATDAAWGVDVALNELAAAVSGCTVWNEPALHHDGSTLFLALRCLVLTGTGAPDVVRSSIEVFSTVPDGDPGGWVWRYRGRLAGHDEAGELGGDGLTQTHFASARDGTLLAFLTPDSWNASEQAFVHHGVRVVEVASLDRPHLARGDDGSLVVLATLTASDLEPFGPGAAAYEPSADVGVVLTKRRIGPGTLVATMHDTGLHP